MVISPDDQLSRKEAAAYLTKLGCPISAQTLANMACNDNAGGGPGFLRFRWRTVRYRRGDLDEWAKRQSVRVE